MATNLTTLSSAVYSRLPRRAAGCEKCTCASALWCTKIAQNRR